MVNDMNEKDMYIDNFINYLSELSAEETKALLESATDDHRKVIEELLIVQLTPENYILLLDRLEDVKEIITPRVMKELSMFVYGDYLTSEQEENVSYLYKYFRIANDISYTDSDISILDFWKVLSLRLNRDNETDIAAMIEFGIASGVFLKKDVAVLFKKSIIDNLDEDISFRVHEAIGS